MFGSKVALKKLFEPGRIGGMEIRNRIVMPAMAHATGPDDDGFATELTSDYYEARARGGVGLIIVGSCSVSWPLGISGKPRLTIHDDKFIPGLARVVEAIHQHGAKAAVQLQHAGPAAQTSLIKMQPVAASTIIERADYAMPTYNQPRELSVAEIPGVIADFARAAGRAQKAGFDGVELHAGHRYLINSFLSPYYNKRQDSYGGDLKNRARFLLEILAAVREAVGPDYPVWCRINGEERDIEGGMTPEIAAQLAPMLQEAGTQAIHVSVWPNRDTGYPPGFALDLAAAVKPAVSIPVIAVGRIAPRVGDKVLRQRKADFIAMGRALLADPELPNKAAAGRLEDIAPCLACNTCLGRDPSRFTDAAVCTMNSALTNEKECEIRPAAKARKVLIIGGGPGGMEAARVAALRGHEVTLYEKRKRLGGQLLLAAILRKENENLMNYLVTQVKRLGVKIELGKEVDAALIARLKPDVVVLATGATSALPDIRGINKEKVISAAGIQEMMSDHPENAGASGSGRRRLMSQLGIFVLNTFGPSAVRPLLRLWSPFGKRVVVVGMGLGGVEIADFLVNRGKKVTIVDTREELAMNEPPMPTLRLHLENKLVEKGVSILAGVKYYEAVNDRGLAIGNKKAVPQTIEGDTILFAANYKSNKELQQALAGTPYQQYQVGDCVEPVGIREALRDGLRVGREI